VDDAVIDDTFLSVDSAPTLITSIGDMLLISVYATQIPKSLSLINVSSKYSPFEF